MLFTKKPNDQPLGTSPLLPSAQKYVRWIPTRKWKKLKSTNGRKVELRTWKSGHNERGPLSKKTPLTSSKVQECLQRRLNQFLLLPVLVLRNQGSMQFCPSLLRWVIAVVSLKTGFTILPGSDKLWFEKKNRLRWWSIRAELIFIWWPEKIGYV